MPGAAPGREQRLKAVGGPLQSARKSGSQMLQTGGQAKPRPHRRPSGRTRRPCLSSPRHSAERSSAAKTLLTCVRPPGPIGQSVLSRDRPGSSQYFDMLRGARDREILQELFAEKFAESRSLKKDRPAGWVSMRRCCPGLSRYDKTSSELSAVAHASRLPLRKCCNSIRQTERERARERERDQGLLLAAS